MSKMLDKKRYPVAYSAAIFSPCRTWRYFLMRMWDHGRLPIAFVGLNPSTADETEDDPTIRRCMGFARSWDAGGIVMLNAYSLRSTDPKGLLAVDDPIGPENDHYLALKSMDCRFVVCAWGAFKMPGIDERAEHIRRRVTSIHPGPASGKQRYARHLGLTASGAPRHPLYLRADTRPELWTP